jgi:FkbM family methyltransferase
MPRNPFPLATLYGLRAFLACGAVVIVFELATWAYPPVLPWGLALMGRMPMTACTATNAFQGAEVLQKQHEVEKAIGSRSRMLQDDQKGLRQWETPDGNYWVPKGSDSVLPILLAQQELDIYAFPGKVMAAGEVVFDCGAHVGVYTRRALKAGAKLVVAIEPSPGNVESLRRNFKEEIEAGRVIVYPKGVWDKEELMPFYQDPDNSAADSFVVRGAKDKVLMHMPLTTIDKIVAELKLDHVDLIKMDIKGATVKALRGAEGTLRTSGSRVVISTEEEQDDPKEIAATFAGLGTGYRVECGLCAVSGDYKVHPGVLFFRR